MPEVGRFALAKTCTCHLLVRKEEGMISIEDYVYIYGLLAKTEANKDADFQSLQSEGTHAWIDPVLSYGLRRHVGVNTTIFGSFRLPLAFGGPPSGHMKDAIKENLCLARVTAPGANIRGLGRGRGGVVGDT
ncbi:MAG: hypothetical protein FRX49_11499 [Trebouxia sp. A1-2]|nr:MAG: hypothetical protein FRX49_11499 [Trebouxia sp. A1-2]